jgi:hypothetical protein
MDKDTTQPKTVSDKKDKKQTILILVIILLLAALMGATYLYWQLENNKHTLSQTQTDKTALEKKLSDLRGIGETTPPAPVTVFSPGGLFTDAEKVEITTKMINPYMIWHKDLGDILVSIHVQQNSVTPRQYTVDAIYKDGVYEGFLYGKVDATSQDWWHPICEDTCKFTNSFKDAYPQSAL